ncbi:MAG: hypothetical protein R3178_11065, partial [Rhodothermales bacterium]|nr:hypothetical protein [Rhodothermales bacterium]
MAQPNEELSMQLPRLIALVVGLVAVQASLGPVDGRAQGVEVVDGWFVVDGERFFSRCIGYETHTRPGQVPWIYEFDPGLISLDLERIKSAGFNTIRTWGALTEEELAVVQNSGLKIIFGIWLDPQGDFGDPAFVSAALDHVRDVVSYTKNYDTIIGYVIMNEPLAEHIHDAGAGELVSLWTRAIDIIAAAHPGIPASVSNTIVGDFVRTDLFGFAAYNAYIYNPVTVTYTHGYSGFVDFLKTKRASNKPLVITEFGLSVSPAPYSEVYGYGGNTLEQQADGDLFMYRSLIEGGAQGGCVFQYHDGWWKGGDATTHDPVAEEWFGLYHFNGSEPWLGTPRPAWSAFEEYNRAIITSPRTGQIYKRVVPVEFFSSGAAASVRIESDGELLMDSPATEGWNTDEVS